MRCSTRRGLTLIELVVVIAIVLLLALSLFWIGSKVRALVVALDPAGVKAREGAGDKLAEKPDTKAPGDKKESPPK
jgi:prepilin-type N-terminal cleavage/methylation domain-containing protein